MRFASLPHLFSRLQPLAYEISGELTFGLLLAILSADL
jgi:hypothetical protein